MSATRGSSAGRSSSRRGRGAAVAAAAAGALMLAAPAGASAGTIRACVQKHSGATRIVSAHARCRRGEKLLTWNTTGPAGAQGAPGASGLAGAPGTNGAAAVFYAQGSTAPVLLPAKETLTAVTKTIPPGSYLLEAKTIVLAEAETTAHAAVVCALLDAPGLAPPPAETPALDLSAWEVPLSLMGKNYEALGTLTLLGSVQSAVTTTVAVTCGGPGAPGVAEEKLDFSQLAAIQASRIG